MQYKAITCTFFCNSDKKGKDNCVGYYMERTKKNTESGSKQQVNLRGKKIIMNRDTSYAKPLAITVNFSRRNLSIQNDLFPKQRVQ